ncbi:MAG TPA: hypothetical protein VLJ17_11490 [Xanthobacteraceae bacterium]|nr:hypothetical protein [Xanthobacteraceae bacterium]
MEPIPPMTLGNMRANGVRSLSVYCIAGHHEAVLDVERWPDHVLVPRMFRTHCRMIGADARPNWKEHRPRESLTGTQWRNSKSSRPRHRARPARWGVYRAATKAKWIGTVEAPIADAAIKAAAR